MKCRQLHGDTWRNLCVGASRNIDTFIGIRKVAPVDEAEPSFTTKRIYLHGILS